MKVDFSNKLLQWATLLVLALIWGSSFILMKRGLRAFDPEEVAAYRIFLVFAILIPFGWKDWRLLIGSKALPFLAVGFFGSILPYFLFVQAQTQIDSALNGILNSLTPMFTLLFAVLIFRQRFKWTSIAGVLLGFTGAVGLIAFSGKEIGLDAFNIYMIMPIIASASYGVNVNLIKRYLQEVTPLSVTTLSFAVVGPLAGVYLFTQTDFVHRVADHPEGWSSLGYLTILGVVGTALAIFAFN